MRTTFQKIKYVSEPILKLCWLSQVVIRVPPHWPDNEARNASALRLDTQQPCLLINHPRGQGKINLQLFEMAFQLRKDPAWLRVCHCHVLQHVSIHPSAPPHSPSQTRQLQPNGSNWALDWQLQLNCWQAEWKCLCVSTLPRWHSIRSSFTFEKCVIPSDKVIFHNWVIKRNTSQN